MWNSILDFTLAPIFCLNKAHNKNEWMSAEGLAAGFFFCRQFHFSSRYIKYKLCCFFVRNESVAYFRIWTPVDKDLLGNFKPAAI